MTHNLLGKAALFTGTVALAAIIGTGPAMAQPAPQPGQDTASVGISNQSARVRADLGDIASDQAAHPGPVPNGSSTETNGDLAALGGGAAGLLLVAAAAGLIITRRHKGAVPRTA
jgi:hypothetical protein